MFITYNLSHFLGDFPYVSGLKMHGKGFKIESGTNLLVEKSFHLWRQLCITYLLKGISIGNTVCDLSCSHMQPHPLIKILPLNFVFDKINVQNFDHLPIYAYIELTTHNRCIKKHDFQYFLACSLSFFGLAFILFFTFEQKNLHNIFLHIK